MKKSRMSGRDALQEAKRLLSAMEGDKATVKKVLALLGVVEAELQRVAVVEPVRQGKTPLVYRVEQTTLGETLAEHRPGGTAQPFRCPRPVWDAVIGVLADAEKPMSAEEIAEAVEKRTGTRPGDHQYRVPLRLLTQMDPPLLTRSRAKYTAAAGDFTKSAKKLWTMLRSS